jgi:hypothetical protein
MIPNPLDGFFDQKFDNDEKCLKYLVKKRYDKGKIICSKCGSKKLRRVKKYAYECAACHNQESILSKTIFQGSHIPMRIWFKAIWIITEDKNKQKQETSALGLQRALGVKSYKTAWTCLQKIRRIMINPERDRLSGEIEIATTDFEIPIKKRKSSSGKECKILLAIAMQITNNEITRFRIAILNDNSIDSLHKFIKACVNEQGSILIANSLKEYKNFVNIGYTCKINKPIILNPKYRRMNEIIIPIRKWFKGIQSGVNSRKYLQYYFDEYTLRYNHIIETIDNSKKMSDWLQLRDKLFERLIKNAVLSGTKTYQGIVAK